METCEKAVGKKEHCTHGGNLPSDILKWCCWCDKTWKKTMVRQPMEGHGEFAPADITMEWKVTIDNHTP